MEQKINVLLIAHNEKEMLQKSIESIRQCDDINNVSIVVVDNASEDGTEEWLSKQEDISYATEEGYVGSWGKVVNEAMEYFTLEGDILLLSPGYTVVGSCIGKLAQVLHSKEEIAAVGPLIDGMNAKTNGSYAQQDNMGNNIERVLELDVNVVMIRGDVFQNNGKMDEIYNYRSFTVLDYLVSCIKARGQLYCVANAAAKKEGESFAEENVWEDVLKIRNKWGMHYFSIEGNDHLINMFTEEKDTPISVLEIGCDCGATLMKVKNRYPNASIYGFEINENSAQIAGTFAEVTVGNIEEFHLPYEKQQFDYILFGDVLEHLHNPSGVVSYCREFLKEGGSIVACIPNVMNISVVADLLEGYFTYGEIGLLDKTHIHMFTFKEMARMFMDAGYSVENVIMRKNPINEEHEKLLDNIMAMVHESERWMFEAFQFVIRAEKK